MTTSAGDVGAIVAHSGFSWPSDAPNHWASISLAGESGAVTVAAWITGTTKLPDGKPASYDVKLDPTHVALTPSGMELYSVCTA